MCHVKKTKYGEENALQIYRDQKKNGPFVSSFSDRQLAVHKIIASNNRRLVTKHLSAHLTPQTSRRRPGYSVFQVLQRNISILSAKTRFRPSLRCISDVRIGFDKQITKVIVQVIIKKGKK